MLETDPHDLSDDADYAASQQHGSYSIMRSESGSRNSSAESDGAEIIYFKDNVAIHPTQFASERINGRLKLIKKGCLLFMTWIPSSGHNPAAMLSEGDKKMYTIRAAPFSDIRSIHRHAPTFGWKYIIIVLSSGLAFAPLYFYSGGIKEFLAAIKQHIFITRSSQDPNVFLVNDFEDRLQRTLSSLKLPHTISIANNSHYSGGDILASPHVGRQRHKINDPARDLSIQVLEKFSLVTKFARETTSQLFRDSHHIEFSSFEDEGKDHSSSFADKSVKEYHDEENIHVESSVVPDPLDFHKLTLVWGKPRETPLGIEEWETFLDCEGRVVDSKALKKRIFYGGVEHGLRKEVWPFLLGYLAFDSTFAEREYVLAIKKSEYNTVKSQWESISPEQAKRFTKFRERKGLIDKDVVRTDRSFSFYDGDDNENVNLLHDILLTYSFYNFDLGYCQGMSDLLAPILFVIKDESTAFWCFDSLMKRLGPNFNRDQSGMHSQLFALSKLVELLDLPLHNYLKKNDCLNYFFCFRWVLIQFKREFEYDDMMRLWEILWTHHLSEHLHLYICVSVLKRHRTEIMGEQMDFDTLLKFINELSGRIHLDSTIRDAEALCICAGENGAASIPPGTPPSLPLTETELPPYPPQEDDEIL